MDDVVLMSVGKVLFRKMANVIHAQMLRNLMNASRTVFNLNPPTLLTKTNLKRHQLHLIQILLLKLYQLPHLLHVMIDSI